ncbi:band 7 protein AGAP004871-like [Saccostrea echinata]|uniref:band 7 protein AGAP004871-like n=1 Tax=Saccostrea echinata TaxID=191078 RepID=UPI002A7F4733|nr:band 7 protein AGAP004871-like [Saccostrea echinata]
MEGEESTDSGYLQHRETVPKDDSAPIENEPGQISQDIVSTEPDTSDHLVADDNAHPTADDKVYPTAEGNVQSAAESNVQSAAEETDGDTLKDSPRKDASATEEFSVSLDETSKSRKKSKKKEEDQVTPKTEDVEMQNEEPLIIAPIDMEKRREEEQKIKMNWTQQLSFHNKVSPADDPDTERYNMPEYHPEKTLDLDKFGATVPVNGASSYNPADLGHRKTETVIGADPDGNSGNIGCCGSILMILSFFLVIVTFPFSLFFCIKVVQEYERAVIFRLGRLLSGGSKGPGIFFVLPCIEGYTKVDLRTVSFDVPPQEILTNDSVTVSVDAVVYYRVCNPTISVANVENAHHATRLLAQTTLRNILGTKSMSEILTDREAISKAMQCMLDEATVDWGIKVERVEIKDVRLPKQLQKAMAAEAEASREARAKVLAAEGEHNASKALKEAADIINTSPAALQLRYLQTLNTIAYEKNSTIIFPLPVDILSSFMK